MKPNAFVMSLFRASLFASLLFAMTSDARAGAFLDPDSQKPDDPPPVSMYQARSLHSPPKLGGKGKDGRAAVSAFLDWASASVPDERDDARQALALMSADPLVASTLCTLGKKSVKTDGTRALVAFALLGEMRSDKGVRCLAALLRHKASPNGPKEVESGVANAILDLERLQAKAVEGIAYRGSADADAIVLDTIISHPSQTVRAAAIDAYLWNRGDTPEARLAILQIANANDKQFIDRIRREEGEAAASFNDKLAIYLQQHPEVNPPDPEDNGTGTKPNEPPGKNAPPPDQGFRFDGTRPDCGQASAPTCNGTCESGQTCKYDGASDVCSCVVEVQS